MEGKQALCGTGTNASIGVVSWVIHGVGVFFPAKTHRLTSRSVEVSRRRSPLKPSKPRFRVPGGHRSCMSSFSNAPTCRHGPKTAVGFAGEPNGSEDQRIRPLGGRCARDHPPPMWFNVPVCVCFVARNAGVVRFRLFHDPLATRKPIDGPDRVTWPEFTVDPTYCF